MRAQKLLTRDQFREAVFSRDGHTCIVCGAPAVDAHHILERRLWSDGGYYIDNGVSVCEPCHLKAEQTAISCEELRSLCGVREACLPDHFSDDQLYDKWGNSILPNGQRMRGELFEEEPVQKILAPVLHLFTNRVKYPRTYHMPFSPGRSDDDKVLPDLDHFDGKEVVATIKMDGECLAASTKIAMADGSHRKISALVREGPGALVMGVNRSGIICPTRVTRVYDNGRTDDWLRVTIRGNATPARHIYCTPSHRFRVNRERYVPASQLQVGDQVELLRVDQGLTSQQEQILLGMLLGAASFQVHHRDTAMIQWSHKVAHRGYMTWIMHMLGKNLVPHAPCPLTSGFGAAMLKGWTVCNNAVYRAFSSMIVDGKKIVPQWVLDVATPLTLAFWIMDDGTRLHSKLQRDRLQISVCGFDEASCEILRKLLLKFDVQSNLHTWGGYRYLYVTADGYERLAELVSPFIPTVMRYKLPDPWRKQRPADPIVQETPEHVFTRFVPVLAVEKRAHAQNRVRYDIETETHNYFAHGILVHNCTTLYRDGLHARSLSYDAHPSRDWIRALHGRISHEIPDTWRICGENLYARHSIYYTDLPSYFMVFSIWDGLTCLSWKETLEWSKMLGLSCVPTTYVGTDHKEAHKAWKDSDNVEGYVLRLAGEFRYSDFRRSVAKYVRKNHVQTDAHWMHGRVTPNVLAAPEPVRY